MRTTPRLATAAAVALLSLGLTGLSAPATAGTPNPDAVKHFQAGMARFRAEDYPGAISEWKVAESIEPTAGLYYNMAVAYKKQGDAQNAIAYYQKFLSSAPADDPSRPEAEKNIQLLQAQIGAQTSTNGAGAETATGPTGAPPVTNVPAGGGTTTTGTPNTTPPPMTNAPGTVVAQPPGPPPGYGQPGYGQPGYQAPGAYGPTYPSAPVVATYTAMERATFAMGFDLGPIVNAGIADTNSYGAGLGWRIGLEYNIPGTNGFWLFGLVGGGTLGAKPNAWVASQGVDCSVLPRDPSCTKPEIDLVQLGGGLQWVHHLVGGLYAVPRAGLSYGQTSYVPDNSNSTLASTYNQWGLLLDASLDYVLGPIILRVTPLSLDWAVGSSWDAASQYGDCTNPQIPGCVNRGGLAYQFLFGASWLY